MMNELESLLVLNAISGLGSARIGKILEYYGSASQFLKERQGDLNHGILSADIIANIQKFPLDQFLSQELKLIEQKNIKVILRSDAQYPANLKRIEGAPIVLYVRGEIPAENEVAL